LQGLLKWKYCYIDLDLETRQKGDEEGLGFSILPSSVSHILTSALSSYQFSSLAQTQQAILDKLSLNAKCRA